MHMRWIVGPSLLVTVITANVNAQEKDTFLVIRRAAHEHSLRHVERNHWVCLDNVQVTRLHRHAQRIDDAAPESRPPVNE
jgi:hypothetical protein